MPMTLQRGSILLFKSSGQWYENLITLATHGPYVHTGICLDASRVIAATPHGIQISTVTPGPLCDSVDLTPYTSQAGIDKGLAWVIEQKEHAIEYGWVDIAYQGLKFLWPNNPLRFGIKNHMDCSDFASRYLQQAGVILPEDFQDPYANSPCDIARIFSLLPPRTGHVREVVAAIQERGI